MRRTDNCHLGHVNREVRRELVRRRRLIVLHFQESQEIRAFVKAIVVARAFALALSG